MMRWLLLCTFCMAPLGCGGGGGTSTGTLDVFATDRLTDDYDQVWLTLESIELRERETRRYRYAYENREGLCLDARRLADGAGGRYLFLGCGELPARSYDRVRVRLRDRAVLVEQKGQAGIDCPLDSTEIEYDLDPPLLLGPAGGALCVDFDLGSSELDAQQRLRLVVREGSTVGLDDPARHEVQVQTGYVAGLGPGGFLLDPPHGAPFSVQLGTGPGPIRNGDYVEVEGLYRARERHMEAYRIEAGPEWEVGARGEVSDVDLDANTMVLDDLLIAVGFTPQGSSVDVVWSDATVFYDGGVVVDETRLLVKDYATVHGDWDEATNTVTAACVHLHDHDGHGPQ